MDSRVMVCIKYIVNIEADWYCAYKLQEQRQSKWSKKTQTALHLSSLPRMYDYSNVCFQRLNVFPALVPGLLAAVGVSSMLMVNS